MRKRKEKEDWQKFYCEERKKCDMATVTGEEYLPFLVFRNFKQTPLVAEHTKLSMEQASPVINWEEFEFEVWQVILLDNLATYHAE